MVLVEVSLLGSGQFPWLVNFSLGLVMRVDLVGNFGGS